MEGLQKIAKDIELLKIQGATNVAISGIKAVAEYGERLPANLEAKAFVEKVGQASAIIEATRPTEPAMQNGLRMLQESIGKEKNRNVAKLQSILNFQAEKWIKMLKDTTKKVAEYGANLIQDGDTIMTHCHSSASSASIIRAFESGKDIKVIATETRPRYQGRKTATELIKAGIPTTQVVDSAMRWAIKTQEVNIIIIGMDAITSLGTVINKIGSRLLALAANESDVPFFVTGTLLKFDYNTVFGNLTEIEVRRQEEITKSWENKPEELRIINPAFESISRDYIDGLVCETGVFPPELVLTLAKEEYPLIFNKTYLDYN